MVVILTCGLRSRLALHDARLYIPDHLTELMYGSLRRCSLTNIPWVRLTFRSHYAYSPYCFLPPDSQIIPIEHRLVTYGSPSNRTTKTFTSYKRRWTPIVANLGNGLWPKIINYGKKLKLNVGFILSIYQQRVFHHISLELLGITLQHSTLGKLRQSIFRVISERESVSNRIAYTFSLLCTLFLSSPFWFPQTARPLAD
jgi:hypothetical protein